MSRGSFAISTNRRCSEAGVTEAFCRAMRRLSARIALAGRLRVSRSNPRRDLEPLRSRNSRGHRLPDESELRLIFQGPDLDVAECHRLILQPDMSDLRAGVARKILELALTSSSCFASSDTAPTSARLTSKRQSLDTGGSALTGRHQPAAREHSHLFGLSRVRVHLLSAWFQRGTGDS